MTEFLEKVKNSEEGLLSILKKKSERNKNLIDSDDNKSESSENEISKGYFSDGALK